MCRRKLLPHISTLKRKNNIREKHTYFLIMGGGGWGESLCLVFNIEDSLKFLLDVHQNIFLCSCVQPKTLLGSLNPIKRLWANTAEIGVTVIVCSNMTFSV